MLDGKLTVTGRNFAWFKYITRIMQTISVFWTILGHEVNPSPDILAKKSYLCRLV